MTMQQISRQATALNLGPEAHELLQAAWAAGMTAGARDAAITCADNGEESAAQMIAANYGFEIA